MIGWRVVFFHGGKIKLVSVVYFDVYLENDLELCIWEEWGGWGQIKEREKS